MATRESNHPDKRWKVRDIIYELKGLLPEKIVVSVEEQLRISEDMDEEVDGAAKSYGYFAILSERAETRYQKMKFAFDQWQAVGFELAQFGQGLVIELVRGDVFDDLAQVTQLALCVDEAGFFLAGFAVANEFHGLPF